MVFLTATECVYSAVWTGSLNVIEINFSLSTVKNGSHDVQNQRLFYTELKRSVEGLPVAWKSLLVCLCRLGFIGDQDG